MIHINYSSITVSSSYPQNQKDILILLMTILSQCLQYTFTGLHITHSPLNHFDPSTTVNSLSLFAFSSSLLFFSSASFFFLSSSMMPLNAFSFSNKLPSIPHLIPSLSLFIVPLTLALNAIASFSTFSEGTSIHHSTHTNALSIVTL